MGNLQYDTFVIDTVIDTGCHRGGAIRGMWFLWESIPGVPSARKAGMLSTTQWNHLSADLSLKGIQGKSGPESVSWSFPLSFLHSLPPPPHRNILFYIILFVFFCPLSFPLLSFLPLPSSSLLPLTSSSLYIPSSPIMSTRACSSRSSLCL